MFLAMLTAVRHYVLLQTAHTSLHFISLHLNILVTTSPQGNQLIETFYVTEST